MPIKNRQQLLVTLAIAAVAVFAADRMLLSPLVSAHQNRSKEITRLRKSVQDGQQLLRRADTIRSRWTQMQEQALPSNSSLAEQRFYKAIDGWAQESRVNIAAITPQWKRDADDYMTYECRLEATGTLGTLTRFIFEVERDPGALRLESVEVGSRDKDGQQITLAMQISGLVLNPPTP